MPDTSARPRAATLSAERIGPAVMIGEATRTRRRAVVTRSAIRCESARPRPGQNHGRTCASPTGANAVSYSPVPSICRVAHSSVKTAEYASAIARESTRTITFSSAPKSSSVQFVDPVQTAASSRTANLWCMRSRTCSVSSMFTPARRRTSTLVRGAAVACSAVGCRSGRWTSARTATPRAEASRTAANTRSPTGPGMWTL